MNALQNFIESYFLFKVHDEELRPNNLDDYP